ncbi:4-hydroxy-3-polyprenylbenzoate decarboxylase [Caldanaerovirga acetigignens]|uniref:4-hydroxy-3-polyprenylbenzoate decarboxylase n=1 Tax=Caldanaerovirga acetigignens TaxID=447595 RepID=A0A1M7K274_9FIRM|nr:menaquinone biosynthesis decarboxylase [Caldanaerovirga acetigignens]SHM59325.1 4-hydroxy-3-polyprenylbenzoate decarboxylase [Caldanaerovirga acetigignens]
MYKDLQEFVNVLEQKGQLKRIKAEVDSELEITEIVDRVVKSGGPALLFENVKGSEFPLLINTFGTYERMKLALEVESLDDIAREIEELIDVSNYVGLFNKIRSATRLARLAKIFPRKVKQAPCQEVVEEPDLSKLPILKCWPGDGGKFITLPLVITRDPETGTQNMGMYRLQVFDEKTTGMHWHLHKDGREIYEKYKRRGQKMPVAVALGCDPATIYASTAPLPKEIDEMVFAGFLRKAPLELVKCKTCDIYVPANAEFVLEGYVDIDELREEGPFGDHTGYYSLKDYYPVFHITCITRKENPIYPATVVGKPPMEDCFLGKATERIFLPFLKILCPEIVDINFPLEGVFHNCVIVSIKKRFPGHAKKVMHALWGIGQMMYTKVIVVVDENVDPKNLSTVAWKVFNNVDPKRDVVIVDGPLDALDHASPMKHYGSKMGIDATKKWKEEGHEREWPDEIAMDPKIKELVDRRWKEYGF